VGHGIVLLAYCITSDVNITQTHKPKQMSQGFTNAEMVPFQKL